MVFAEAATPLDHEHRTDSPDGDTLGPGATIANFRVIERVGEGGLATVYRVRHLTLGSDHALKVLRFEHVGQRARLLQEGRIQAGLRHPNIVAVTDVLEVGLRPGLLMELVDGTTLQHVLADGTGLPVEEALELFRHLLAGVGAAHAAGVLHRDLKPANVLLAARGRGVQAKIADFGIARCPGEAAALGLTRAGSMLGTPGYMAPEQALDAARADERSDIFSLGVILYEMFAGRPPFAGPDLLTILNRASTQDYRPIATAAPGCPPAVAVAIERALSAAPQDRFQTCEAFAAALFGRDEPPAERVVPVQRALTAISSPEPTDDVATLVDRPDDPAGSAPTMATLVPLPPAVRRAPRRRRTIAPILRISRFARARAGVRRALARLAGRLRPLVRRAAVPALLLGLLAGGWWGWNAMAAQRRNDALARARAAICATAGEHVEAARLLQEASKGPDRMTSFVAAVGTQDPTACVAALAALRDALKAELGRLPYPRQQLDVVRRRSLSRHMEHLDAAWRDYEDAVADAQEP